MRKYLLAAAVAGLCCGLSAPTLSAEPNMETKLNVDGHERKYLLHVPAKVKDPAPLVIAMHGGGGKASNMERLSRFDALAGREGFIVVYPEALDGYWNDGRGVEAMRSHKENIDDVKFLRAVVDDVAVSHKIDRSRIFATGISNGGFMSHRLAAEASDMVAAIAPVVGGLAQPLRKNFAPKYPVSILIVQGDADPIVPIGGGGIGLPADKKRGEILPTAETLALYVKRNGAAGEPARSTLDKDPQDKFSVDIAKYPDGPGGVKTQYYLVHGGGHNWPGQAALPRNVKVTESKVSPDFSATDVIWEFFKSCPGRAGTAK
jgi:polyhydroxybutyrate depolymerase